MAYDDLSGKTVLVTGGSSGLGLAIAGAFAENGARVIVVGRDPSRIDGLARHLGANVSGMACDLSKTDLLPGFVDSIYAAAGRIDVLVNNAGINMKKPAESVSTAEYETIIRTNQIAVFALTRDVGRRMVQQRSGVVLMISSMASHYGIPGVVAYTASKAAVEGMTRALAVEWSPHGVRVNCIAPGFIATPMSARALDNDPARKARVLSRTPMGVLGEPADIAHAALFLASSHARYITGVVLPVDGGNAIGF